MEATDEETAKVQPAAGSTTNHRPARRERPQAKKKGLPWTLINFWLDAAIGIAFVAHLWSAVVVHFVFPPGPEASGWMLWGLGFDAWSGVQFTALCVLTIGVLLHVMFHWSWVCGVLTARILPRDATGKKKNWDDGVQTLIGVGLIVVLLTIMGIGIAAAQIMLQAPPV